MGAISLILISCVPKSEIAYISIASDRGLCTAWMYMPDTDKRNKHYEAEISERRLNCNTVINNPRADGSSAPYSYPDDVGEITPIAFNVKQQEDIRAALSEIEKYIKTYELLIS